MSNREGLTERRILCFRLAATVRVALLMGVVFLAEVRQTFAIEPENARVEAEGCFARANELFARGDVGKGRGELTKVLTMDVPEAYHSIAQLEIARSFESESNSEAAKAEYRKVMEMKNVPAHHREEAEKAVAVLSGEPRSGAETPTSVPQAPAREFHLSPTGKDSTPGTSAAPFLSLDAAMNAIRGLRKEKPGLEGPVVVWVHGGTFHLTRSLRIGSADSGNAHSPTIFRAAAGESPVFTGGIRLSGFEKVANPDVLANLSEPAREHVMQVNIRASGITNILPLELGGFASGRGFKTHPAMELFFNGAPQPLARWPNQGFIEIMEVTTNEPISSHGLAGTKLGIFKHNSERPLRWTNEKDPWLYGYWFWDWADSYERVSRIDTEKHEIQLAPPFHGYGYRKGQKFFALNLLSEIDEPGEWYLDRASGLLYFWPPQDPNSATVELSTASFTLVEMEKANYVRMEGLTFDLGAADAISIKEGSDCLIAGCTVSRFAGTGITISGGEHHGVQSCDIFSLGRGGIAVSGGDRKTLKPGRHFVENCHIYDLSRIDHTYTPGVMVSGVGHRLGHNLMDHVRSSGINLSGNDHLVELNEIARVVQESDDQGAVDMFGNPTYRGNVFRWNYFHHIGMWKDPRNEPALGQGGIRLDDAICGTLVYGNIFRRAAAGKLGFGGVQIHGGKENIIDDNLFVDCLWAISFSPWGEAHWLEYTREATKDIDPALYQSRYPGIARLNENLNRNEIWRNQFINCEKALYRNKQESAISIANQERKATPAVENDLTSFKPGQKSTSNEIRAAGIPLEQIGLREDQWRKKIPAAMIARLRSDEEDPK